MYRDIILEIIARFWRKTKWLSLTQCTIAVIEITQIKRWKRFKYPFLHNLCNTSLKKPILKILAIIKLIKITLKNKWHYTEEVNHKRIRLTSIKRVLKISWPLKHSYCISNTRMNSCCQHHYHIQAQALKFLMGKQSSKVVPLTWLTN